MFSKKKYITWPHQNKLPGLAKPSLASHGHTPFSEPFVAVVLMLSLEQITGHAGGAVPPDDDGTGTPPARAWIGESIR